MKDGSLYTKLSNYPKVKRWGRSKIQVKGEYLEVAFPIFEENAKDSLK